MGVPLFCVLAGKNDDFLLHFVKVAGNSFL